MRQDELLVLFVEFDGCLCLFLVLLILVDTYRRTLILTTIARSSRDVIGLEFRRDVHLVLTIQADRYILATTDPPLATSPLIFFLQLLRCMLKYFQEFITQRRNTTSLVVASSFQFICVEINFAQHIFSIASELEMSVFLHEMPIFVEEWFQLIMVSVVVEKMP